LNVLYPAVLAYELIAFERERLAPYKHPCSIDFESDPNPHLTPRLQPFPPFRESSNSAGPPALPQTTAFWP
jgi:hypothetical protein